ncbi:MAG: hypothetical protein A3A83_04335 [Candidatus Doudnabacteria bacterium RIFCSPLOWO2_01_FULL_48_57]|nr:MAG: hypothetical protein A3K05_03645 [Candidatus Doudnabacteria bacterium RIFCSPHIGHO2_01_48_18]OGE91302.1 MAG: hypothetical protein A3F44_03260 [Candidatus Doudnabacteria bacterium RIFCSPHIGHO2_12_FULL_47_25]OGE97794.1 MAG: hypothetical protein A3A83_04335 [Candidatus Doudnabacteria bacterium RIFCSPLOWO2_01_FULL_48_57]
MKKVFLLTVLLFVITAPLFAQKAQQEAGQIAAATSLSFPIPSPRVIINDTENDTWPAPPLPPPTAPGTPPMPPMPPLPRITMDIVTVQARSNGLQTIIALGFSGKTDMKKLAEEMVGNVYLDTDQDPGTGATVRYDQDSLRFEPRIGYEASISFWGFPRSGRAELYKVRGNDAGYYVQVEIVGQMLSMVIPNEVLGEFGDGEMHVAVAIADYQGVVDVAPNQGYGWITSIRKLSVSPDSSLMVTAQSFDIGITVEMDSPNSPFQKLVIYDGVDMTRNFESAETVGEIKQSIMTRGGKSFRYRVPANAMMPGEHTVGVFVIGHDGIAAKEVKYLVLQTSDPGSN